MKFNLPALFRTKAAPPAPADTQAAYGFASWLSGLIRESFPGAWQKNVVVETKQNILAFSAVHTCTSMIAGDIAKMRIMLVQRQPEGYWKEVTSSAFSPVLNKPNRYQTRVQFLTEWIIQLLIHGNTYVVKERDARSIVTGLYIVESPSVVPLIAPDGSVWYRIKRRNPLAGLVDDEITLPASEIIHDRMECLFHPLVGISPIYACAASATQGIRIQANSAQFFENMSLPSGHLTAPAKIDDVTAERLKREFEENYSGGKIGRLFVSGGNIKYEPFTMAAQDAQLIEQLRWTVEDVARCFHVPLYKIASINTPSYNNLPGLQQDYYQQCLQIRIEAIEVLLDEGLGLGPAAGTTQEARLYGTMFDLDGLLRMDPVARSAANKEAIGSGYFTPNEARLRDNLPPIDGGEVAYMQSQNWPLAKLRDRQDQPPALPAPEGGANQNAPKPTGPDGTGTAPSDAQDAAKAYARAVEDARRFTVLLLEELTTAVEEA